MLPPQGPTGGSTSIKIVEPSEAIAKLKGIDVSEAAKLVKENGAEDQHPAAAEPA